MFFSIAQTTALLLSSTSLTLAFGTRGIAIPPTIAAGVNAEIEIDTSIFDPNSGSFYVSLATTPPGWGTGVACYLTNLTTITTSSSTLTVQIPADIGPSGIEYYSFLVEQYIDEDDDSDGYTGGYTDNFLFTGGTGYWSEYELSGNIIASGIDLPCTAYACARNCSQAFYPSDTGDDLNSYQSAYECIAACPGVDAVSWDEEEFYATATGDASYTASPSTTVTESAGETASSTLSTTTGSAPATKVTSGSSTVSKSSPVSASGKTASSSGPTSTSGSATSSGANASSTSTKSSDGMQNSVVHMGALLAGTFGIFIVLNL